MRFRHSPMSFAIALACAAGAACAASGADNEHGPTFLDEGGSDATARPEGGGDASQETSTPGSDATQEVGVVDALGESKSSDGGEGEASGEAATDASDAGAGDTGAVCTSTMALLAAGPASLAEAVYASGQWSMASTVSGGAAAAPTLVPFGGGY